MAEQTKKVTLRTRDSSIFEIEEAIAKEFGTLKSIMEEEGSANSLIPLPNVWSPALVKIIEYCRKHLEFRTMADNDAGNQFGDAKAFDDGFVKDLTNDEIKELILAANYLDVKELLDFLNQTIADRIKNKSVEYVRKFFGIVNDYTPEEENALREKYAWAYEGVDDD